MSLILDNLTKDANASGSFHTYQYVTEDNKSVVIADDYFLKAHTKLNIGSHIKVAAQDVLFTIEITASTFQTVTVIEPSMSVIFRDGFEDLKPTGEFIPNGAAAPTNTIYRSVHILPAYAGTGANDKATFRFHFPHDLIPGSGFYFHTHWGNNQAAPTGVVNWRVTWTYARGYGLGAHDTDIVTDYSGSVGSQYDHIISESSEITAATVGEDTQADGIILATLERLTGDTNDDDAFLIEFDIHYQSDGKVTVERTESGSGYTKV